MSNPRDPFPMTSKRLAPLDDDNPEWTVEDFASAQPASEMPPELAAAFPLTKNRGGRPKGSAKESVAIRIDKDVLEQFRADGPGWQTRMNDVLRKSLTSR